MKKEGWSVGNLVDGDADCHASDTVADSQRQGYGAGAEWQGLPRLRRGENGLPRQCEHWLAMTGVRGWRGMAGSQKLSRVVIPRSGATWESVPPSQRSRGKRLSWQQAAALPLEIGAIKN